MRWCDIPYEFYRCQSVYSMVGLHGNGKVQRAKQWSSKGPEGGVLGKGTFPSPPIRGLGSAVSSPTGVRGKVPVTWRLKKFYTPQSRSWCRFCWYSIYSVKFSWSLGHRRPNFCGIWTPVPIRDQCLRWIYIFRQNCLTRSKLLMSSLTALHHVFSGQVYGLIPVTPASNPMRGLLDISHVQTTSIYLS